MTSTGIPAVLAPELGKYHLIAELARGGMGNVYLAVAQGPGGFHKLLVVKELRPELTDDETYIAMFLEEARLAARLTHPNIVQTNEVDSDGSRHYMIMEYLDGRSLHRVAKYLARQGGLPIGAHLRVIANALLGLHYAHELCGFDGEPLGIVHRDMSPLNLLVTFDGQTKVLDFGIAKAVDTSLETQAGVLKGRIAYMAPEQARGGKVDRRADVYAAGVMIWEAAAGRRLWRGMTDVEILTKTLGQGPPRLRSVQPSAPSDLDALCARAMAIDPANRHATAAALLAQLDEHLMSRDDAMSMREIGAVVSRAFEPERQRMNAIIEDVLVRMRAAPRSGVMPTLASRPLGAEKQSSALAEGLADDLASISSLLAATPSAQLAVERSMRSRSALRLPRVTVPDAWEPPRSKGKRAAVAVGALAGACFVLAALAVVQLCAQGQKANAVEARRGSPPAVAPPRPDPKAADLDAPATLVPVDSRAVATSSTNVPRYGSQPGWAPPSQHASRYDSPEPARPASTSAEAPAGAAPAARQEVDPTGGRAPLRPIIKANPYGAP
jgi:serine/threonine-protein kinase